MKYCPKCGREFSPMGYCYYCHQYDNAVEYMGKKHYEVESKLNPRYEETGLMEDYYGVYEVVEYRGDVRITVIATYRAVFTGDGRYNAYDHARRLNEAVD